MREKARHGTGARAEGRDNDTRDGKITAVNAVRMPCQSVTRPPLAASLGLLVVHNRSFVSCFMSAAAPRAENMLFATDTHSDCISATNAVAVCRAVGTSRPQRGRGTDRECANYVRGGNLGRVALTVGLGRSLFRGHGRRHGRPHPQRQQIPENDNADDNAGLRQF